MKFYLNDILIEIVRNLKRSFMSKRINFFISHLIISFFVALITIGCFFIWYLSPLIKAVGVTHIFLTMLM